MLYQMSRRIKWSFYVTSVVTLDATTERNAMKMSAERALEKSAKITSAYHLMLQRDTAFLMP